MKEYFQKLSDEKLIELVSGYSMTTIPYEHPIRNAAFDLFGKEDIDSLTKMAPVLLLVVTERLVSHREEHL